jgi:glycerophosphoryl diester phosphodiesterase
MAFRLLRRLVALVLVPPLLVPTLGIGAAGATDASGQVANVAHRGASYTAPENTMSAFTQAIAERADYIGIDVRLTYDGVPVVLHDRSLARTTDVEELFPDRAPWYVEDLTLAEVRRLDAGSWRSPAYAGERVPTLAEVLQELAPSPTGIMLEIKDAGLYGGTAGIGDVVVRTLDEVWTPYADPTGRQLVVQSFDKAFLHELHLRYPGLRLGLLGSAEPADLAELPFADTFLVSHVTLTEPYVEEAHARLPQALVGAWTVDDPARMAELVSLDVDSISTNRPDLLRDLLSERNARFQPERWPRRSEDAPTWQLTAPGSALVGSRVLVSARLTAADGSPARWQWASLQSWVDGQWRTLQMRATDSDGSFTTSVAARPSLRLRVVSADNGDYRVARSAARDVELRRYATRLRLFGQDGVRAGQRAALEVRWRAEDGRPVTGESSLWRRNRDGSWRRLRDVTVNDGVRKLFVRTRRTARYELRGLRGSWFGADADRHHVLVR